MASTSSAFISVINTAFPVAGVDNDTQGFRDNYANIKNGMTALSNEVTTIQATGVFVNQENDFLSTGVVKNALFKSNSSVKKQATPVGVKGSQTIDFTEGNYQVWKISSATTFSFANFPDTAYHAPVQVELFLDPSTTTNYTVTFVASTSTDLLLDYNANNQVTNPVTLTTASSVIYEVARTNNVLTNSNTAYRVRFVGGPFKP